MNDIIYCLGIDIGGSNIKYLLRSDESIIVSGSHSTQGLKNNKDVLHLIYGIIDSIIQNHKANNIKRIGIGSKGRINTEGVIESSSFGPLIGLDLVNALQEKYYAQVKIVNDASLPYYAINDADKVKICILCVTLGTGIGTAIFSGGKKVGDETFSSKFSSTPFREETHEYYVSQRFLLDQAKINNLSIKTPYELSLLAIEGNEIARHIFKQYGANIGEVLSTLIDSFEVDEIYFSGGITQGKELFLKDTQNAIKKYSQTSPNLKIMSEKYEIGAYGASNIF